MELAFDSISDIINFMLILGSYGFGTTKEEVGVKVCYVQEFYDILYNVMRLLSPRFDKIEVSLWLNPLQQCACYFRAYKADETNAS